MLLSPSSIHVTKWSRAEFIFSISNNPKHFTSTWMVATFKNGNINKTVRGFYDDDGRFILRFMPQQEGNWEFITQSNIDELNNIEGSVYCEAASQEETGPVERDAIYHFKYANGKTYYPFGTTAYVWNHQSDDIQKKTLASLENSPFNKIRMCVFPKHYTYNFKEPERFAFPGNIEDGFDFSRFDCVFFRQLESQIDELKRRGIEADLIIFHPYDRWGFSQMDEEIDSRYVEYLVARLSSFSNIWWSLANEFDLLKEKTMSFWDTRIKQISKEDPYGHLMSIHNWHTPPLHYTNNDHWYDHHSNLLTHASIQHHDLWFVPGWRNEYSKPIVIDECRYEGNIDCGWGCITAQKMVNLFWEGVCAGGYVTHGESYLSDDDIIWWSHGGVLKGESTPRIAFLRSILEEGSSKRLFPKRIQKNAQWDTLIGHMGDDYLLVWLGENQPAFKWLAMLPEGKSYYIDIIDSWNMTITRLPETYKMGDKLALPGKTGIALRMTLVNQ